MQDVLIVALDVPSVKEARRLVDQLDDHASFFKIGMELLFQEGGLNFAKEISAQGKKLFLDAKAFDIPRTVDAALRSLDAVGATFVSVHSLSRALLQSMAERTLITKVVGITLLTSMDKDDMDKDDLQASEQLFNPQTTPEELVLSLADQAVNIGKLDGLVASGKEVAALRHRHPKTILIVPGIRPHGAEKHDQRRTSSAHEAVAAGADHIVVGRTITQAQDPRAAVAQIFEEIEQGLQNRPAA